MRLAGLAQDAVRRGLLGADQLLATLEPTASPPVLRIVSDALAGLDATAPRAAERPDVIGFLRALRPL